jgi:hypothetical protein
MRSRCEKWQSVAPNLVNRAVANAIPAVNTGVFAFTKKSQIMEPWLELTKKNPIFIADEIAMQLLYLDYPHRLLDDRYNCSGVYGAHQQDVVIWHFHGDKHLREGPSRSAWWPVYKECVEGDVGGINKWSPGGDNSLRDFLGGSNLSPQMMEN